MNKTGSELIAEERERQIKEEQFSPAHDDEHDNGALALAGASYAVCAVSQINKNSNWPDMPVSWPWDEEWWKPKDPIRNLARAGALIAAEIDRLQRLEAMK